MKKETNNQAIIQEAIANLQKYKKEITEDQSIDIHILSEELM